MEYFNNTTHLKTEGRYEDRLYFLTVTSWDKLNKMDKEVAYNLSLIHICCVSDTPSYNCVLT